MMERTIDRTSYRRSARINPRINEKIQETSSKTGGIKNRLINILLNQIIVSLLIIIGVLTAKYFDKTYVFEWISDNMSNGHGIIETYSNIKKECQMKYLNVYSILNSGDKSGEEFSTEYSGDVYSGDSGDLLISGEDNNNNELISAVEGINQMYDDAQYINETYDFYLPVDGTITSNFGNRESNNPIISSYHTGLDIGNKIGTEIHAAHGGKVIMAKEYSSYGNCVMIENDKLITVYAHCALIKVKEGQNVNKGDIIATVGMTGNATGPHLHFEVRFDGRFVNPVDVLDEF